MAKTRSMTRNQNHVDKPTKKRSKTIEKAYSATWSELNHDVLLFVVMQLGVVDFLAFSRVCKSWRIFALSINNTFMASRAPMLMWISDRVYKKECYLEDFEGRKYKTLLPHSGSRTCVGLTCGYLVLFGRTTRDLWLVNPITGNELHFPGLPFSSPLTTYRVRAILVYSPIMSEYVFVMIDRERPGVWFSIAGKGSWNHVSSTLYGRDLLVLKGKIYILTTNTSRLYEARLYPEPKLVLLHETDNFLSPLSEIVSSGENLYVNAASSDNPIDLRELDSGEKEWVRCEKTNEEYAIFMNSWGRHVTAMKPESWAEHHPRYGVGSYNVIDKKGKIGSMWYFPHECLNVNLIDE